MGIYGRKMFFLLSALALLVFAIHPTHAVNQVKSNNSTNESILLTSTRDTMIASGLPNISFDGNDRLKIGYDQTNGIWKTLITYDLSSIPAGSTVQSAYFRVYPVQSSPPMNISVYRLSSSWSSGTTYIGDPFDPSDPYLNFYFPASTAIQNFNITSFVQSWVNNPSTNFGIEVIGPTSGSTTTTREIYSNDDPYKREPELYVTFTPPPPPKAWTIMYFLAEDNNLSENSIFQVSNLRAATINGNINITVFYDGKTSEATYLGLAPTQDEDFEKPLGELSTGDPDTLSDFIQWSQLNYQADHYALVLYDHASGVTGFGFDDHPNGDSTDCSGGACLTFRELQQALNAHPKLDIIYIDACSSGTFEVAYELRDRADYLIASQQTAWGPHNYAGPLIGINQSTTAPALATSMAKNYFLAASGDPDNGQTFTVNWPGTISVVDLSLVNNVKVGIDNLANSLSANMQDNHAEITSILADVQHHDTDSDSDIDSDDEFVDLYDFSLLVNQRINDTVTQNFATDLITILNQYVVWNRSWSGTFSFEPNLNLPLSQIPCMKPLECTWELDRSYGVSIFFPNYSRSFYKDGWLDFTTGTIWDILLASNTTKVEGTISSAWGPMLVEYVRNANPTQPDNPNPPPLQAPFSFLNYTYLPITQK